MKGSSTMRRLSFKHRAALLCLLALLATACGSGGGTAEEPSEEPSPTETAPPSEDAAWQQVIEKAQEEGSVNLYLSPIGVGERLAAAMQEKYGIHVEVLRAPTGELVTRVTEEIANDAPGADVVFLSDEVWYQANGDVLAELTGPDVERWLDSEYAGENYFLPATTPFVIAYNTSLIDEPVTGYEDLLRPELKGKVGGTDAASATTILALYEWLGDNVAPDYLEKLAANDLVIYPSVAPLIQAVAAGEVAAALIQVPSSVQPIIAEGAPVEMVMPEPAMVYGSGVGVLAKSGNPNAAQLLVNFMASEEGQAVIHEDKSSASPLDPVGLEVPEPIRYDPGSWTADEIDAALKAWMRTLGRS